VKTSPAYSPLFVFVLLILYFYDMKAPFRLGSSSIGRHLQLIRILHVLQSLNCPHFSPPLIRPWGDLPDPRHSGQLRIFMFDDALSYTVWDNLFPEHVLVVDPLFARLSCLCMFYLSLRIRQQW